MPVPSTQRADYYKAAVLGLRHLDATEGRGRRFGPDADARWRRFAGKLHDGDRLQVLLRDAAVAWGVAFAGARIFRADGVALDEPFGPTWVSPNPAEARRYLDSADSPSLSAAAAALGVNRAHVNLPELRPTTRLVLAGGAAILAAAQAFTARPDLDWSRQVLVVADTPAHRQLAGLAALFVGATQPGEIRASTDGPLPEGGARVISRDAEPACAALLRL